MKVEHTDIQTAFYVVPERFCNQSFCSGYEESTLALLQKSAAIGVHLNDC